MLMKYLKSSAAPQSEVHLNKKECSLLIIPVIRSKLYLYIVVLSNILLQEANTQEELLFLH